MTSTIGYQAGSRRDGGSMRTWHRPGTSVEWDEFYFAEQPLDHVLHDGAKQPDLIGTEYLCTARTTCPDGPYAPLGLP